MALVRCVMSLLLGVISARLIVHVVCASISIMSIQLPIIFALIARYPSPIAPCAIRYRCVPNALSGRLLMQEQG